MGHQPSGIRKHGAHEVLQSDVYLAGWAEVEILDLCLCCPVIGQNVIVSKSRSCQPVLKILSTTYLYKEVPPYALVALVSLAISEDADVGG